MPIEVEKTWSPDGSVRYRPIDYWSKEVVHDPDKPMLHPTVLILVAIAPTSPEKQCQIVLADKAPKLQRLPIGIDSNPTNAAWDCCGGHLELNDVLNLARLKLVDPLTECIDYVFGNACIDKPEFEKACAREAAEEIVLTGKDAPSLDNLKFLLELPEYGPMPMPDGGVNHEVSYVYALVLPADYDWRSDLVLRDDYLDRDGKQVQRELRTRSFIYEELWYVNWTKPEYFCDGATRVVKYLRREGIDSKRFMKMLGF